MSNKGLGINKDLEPLVRAVRRAGGTVEVTGATHVKWTFPNGAIHRTGLTMSDRAAHLARKEIQQILADLTCPAPDGPPPGEGYEVVATDGGKWLLRHVLSDEVVVNANGYPRTFGTREAAEQARRDLPGR